MSDTRERLKKNTRKRKQPRLLTRLQEKVESLSELLASESLYFPEPQSQYAREFYQRLPLGVQRKILKDTEFYIQVLKDFRLSGGSLYDSRRLTWAFLKTSSLQPCSTTFSKIDDKDVIEIFNTEYIQVFRNMHFLEAYRGSLLELCILDWMSLYKRPASIEEQLFLQIDHSFRQLAKVQAFQDIPKHRVELRFGSEISSFESELKYRSGLMSRSRRVNRVEAVLAVSRMQLLHPQEFSRAI